MCKREKLYLTIIMIIVLSLSLFGCGKKKDNSVDNNVNNESQYEQNENNYDPNEEGVYGDEIESYSLEDIADLNDVDVDDLFINYSGEYINFIGCPYTDMKVQNEEDAKISLGYISSLLGADDLCLTYNRTDVSPITNNVYYTFFQTQDCNLGGDTVPARYFNNLVKVITDNDGNVIGASADLFHGELSDFTENDMISKDDAIAYIQSIIEENEFDVEIYTDSVELIYWEDNTAKAVGEGRVAPAWVVYVDNPYAYNDDDTENAPYKVIIVSAVPSYRNEEDELKPIVFSEYESYGIGSDDDFDFYTSELFFKGLSDGGQFSYTIDLGWVKDSYPEYSGISSMDISVDTLYDEASGYYILGSLDRKLVAMNYCDIENYNSTNVLVSNNPEDINSWSFETTEEPNTGNKYFCDPNYVLGSYATMCDVYDQFDDIFGIKSIDGSGMPVMLQLYAYYGDEYPTDISEFVVNAYNSGQNNDWETISTSPMLAECLNPVVMGHEYTHGINSQLTESQYMNSQGAIMESYADIIGKLSAKVAGNDIYDSEWGVSGYFYNEFRNMAEPNIHNQAQYVGGKYYIYPINSATSNDNNDYGGVHWNSGICNKVAYEFSNGEDLDSGEENLSIKENLDLWFETLYCATYMTNYNDIGNFLYFAGICEDLPDSKIDHIVNVMNAYGLFESENDDNLLMDEGRNIHISGSFENPELSDYYAFCVSVVDDNGDGTSYCAGGLSEYFDRTFTIGEDDIRSDKVSVSVDIGDIFYGINVGNAVVYNVPSDTDNIYFEFYEIPLGPNDYYVFETDEIIYGPEDFLFINDDHYAFGSEEYGSYIYTTQNVNEDPSEFHIYYFSVEDAS